MDDIQHPFRKGLVDALPIFFGYLAVGFTLAVAAVAKGFAGWAPVLLAGIQISGTGQGAITNGVSFVDGAAVGLAASAIACMALNLRYVLLSLALSQRLRPGVTLRERLLVALGVTDEIVAVAISRPFRPSFVYVMGLLLCSWTGWVGGSALGVVGTSLLPADLLAPLGIALYAMFIAIVTPMAKKSRPILVCVAIAAGLNLVLHVLPAAIRPSDNLSMLASGLVAAGVCAALFPHREEASTPEGKEDPA